MPQEEQADTLIEAFAPENIYKDIIAVLAWLVLAVVFIYVPALNETALRVVFALPVILFIPGYTLIAALFPQNDEIDGIERIALSFGLSIAVSPLIGLALNYTPWGIRLDPIVTSLVIFSVAMLIVAQYRRFLLPAEKRFYVPARKMLEEARSELFPAESSKLDRALSVILIISIVVAISVTIFVIVVPKEGEKFTEFYILGESGKATDYPTEFYAGSVQNITIGIGNHEYRNVTYFVEVFMVNQTVDEVTNISSIDRMELLGRTPVAVPDNETIEFDCSFTVQDPDINKIEFLLFKDSYPEIPPTGFERINESYRDLHLWVDVEPQP